MGRIAIIIITEFPTSKKNCENIMPSVNESRIYRVLYGASAASLIVTLSWSLLAISQSRAIYDQAKYLHPNWQWIFLIALAVAVELVILSVGLALSHIDNKWLWIGEIFLITISFLFAFDAVAREQALIGVAVTTDTNAQALLKAGIYNLSDMHGISIVRALFAAMLSIQYVVAIKAGQMIRESHEKKTTEVEKNVGGIQTFNQDILEDDSAPEGDNNNLGVLSLYQNKTAGNRIRLTNIEKAAAWREVSNAYPRASVQDMSTQTGININTLYDWRRHHISQVSAESQQTYNGAMIEG